MKRNIGFVLALLVAAAGYAQEMVTVTLKDGSVRKYPSGIETTNIRLWSGAGEGGEMASLDAGRNAESAYEGLAGVRDFDHSGTQWAVALTWFRDFDFPPMARTGICIGRNPGVSAEACDTLFFEDVEDDAMEVWRFLPLSNEEREVLGQRRAIRHYVLLGDSLTFFKGRGDNHKFVWKGQYSYSFPYNWCNYPLQRGQTYYYRAFVQVPYVSSDGVSGLSYSYGPEQTFRIPNLKKDAGYDSGDIYFSDAAWTAFLQHFPEDMSDVQRTALTTYSIPMLRRKWEATFEASPYDLSTAEEVTFDDGIVHILPAMPEEFWTWISTREIVAEMASLQVPATDEGGKLVPQTLLEWVTDVDPAWGIPGNRYVVATPNPEVTLTRYYTRYNDTIVVNLSEAIPGIRYKLTVTMAPETRFTPEQDDEGNYIGDNRAHFLPVRFRMSCKALNTQGHRTTPWGNFAYRGTSLKLDGSYNFTTSATALTTYEFTDIDFSCSLLLISSEVRLSDFNRGTQTNELHVAEVRLTPLPEGDE